MNIAICKIKNRGLNYLLVALGAVLSLPAHSVPVTLTYTGIVSRLAYASCQSFDGGSCDTWDITWVPATDFVNGSNVKVGDAFVGGFTYESGAPLTAMSSDGFQAIHLNSVYDTFFQSSELFLPAAELPGFGMGSFSVVNNHPISGFLYDAFYLTSDFSQGDWFASVNFHLQDRTGVALSSFEVPLSLDFSSFNGNVFRIGFIHRPNGDGLQLYGDLTSVTFSSVAVLPEPASAALLLLGFLVGVSVFATSSRTPRFWRDKPLLRIEADAVDSL